MFSAGSITVGAERKIWFLHPMDHWKMLFPKSGKYFAINKSYQIYNFLLFLYQPSIPCITFTNPNTDFFSQKKNNNWYKIEKNHMPVPRNAIFWLSHSWSGDNQGQEMFLVPSADKNTCYYDTECTNHHPSQLPYDNGIEA